MEETPTETTENNNNITPPTTSQPPSTSTTSFEKSIQQSLSTLTSQNIEERPLYLTTPNLEDKVLTSYVTYTLKGTLIPSPILRRYSDFFSLREKLLERWPGIYIPPIPPKKAIGNTDIKIIQFRLRLLNNFLHQLSQIPFLLNSEEVTLFISNSQDVAGQINNLSELNSSERITRYKNAFMQGVQSENEIENVNEEIIIKHKDEIYQSYDNVKQFREFVVSAREKKEREIKNYICLLNVFEDYEKYSLIEYADGNEDKLVFADYKNQFQMQSIALLKEKMMNPFDALVDNLEEDELDLLAMKEAFDSICDMKSEYARLKEEHSKLIDKIIEIKTEVKVEDLVNSMKFQSMENEKILREIGLKYLNLVIQLSCNHMVQYIEVFKERKMVNYYKHLNSFKEILRNNNRLMLNVWKEIANNKNVNKKNNENEDNNNNNIIQNEETKQEKEKTIKVDDEHKQ